MDGKTAGKLQEGKMKNPGASCGVLNQMLRKLKAVF
jgi:hypothetical protein